MRAERFRRAMLLSLLLATQCTPTPPRPVSRPTLPPAPSTTEEALQQGLVDPDPAVRAAAAASMGWTRQARWVPSLQVALRQAPPNVALAVIIALFEIGGQPASEALLAGLALPDPDVGWWLEYALGHTARPESLMRALNQPEPLKRARVARSLGWAAHLPAVPALEALLTHNPEEVRLAAAWALTRIARPGGSTALRQALGDPSPKVVAQVARALGPAKDRRAVSALLSLLADRGRPTDVLAAASEALGVIGDPRAIQPLIDSVLFVDGANHKDAVYDALKRFGKKALPALWTASLRIAMGKEDIESLGVTDLAMELGPTRDPKHLRGPPPFQRAGLRDRAHRLGDPGAPRVPPANHPRGADRP